MSLAALADHMASKGRGGDSMLVHMAPQEVQALQALAQRHGKTLTINPETGQPEALSLKSLLPAIAGFALGPAGFGLMSAGMAGATVGGITALATGDISRGLMAGLGAYGGAGLGEALMGAGAGAAQQAAMAGMSPEQIAAAMNETGLTQQGVLNQAAADAATTFAKSGATSQMGAGLEAITKSPEAFGTFAKDNWKTLAAATVPPMLASEGVKTTTPRPMDTGYIRQKKFNPYTQQYVDLEPVKASEWGSRRFSDYADGGIVALADGGMSVADMYKQFAGREADPGGAQYWAEKFGSSVDPTEAATFRNAIAEARAQGTEPAAQQPVYNQYTGSQINQYIRDNNLDAAGIAAAIKQFNVDPNAVITAQNAPEQIQNVYRNVLGRDVDPSGLQYWTDRIVKGGVSGEDMYKEFLSGAQANKEIIRNPNLTLDQALQGYKGYTSSDATNIADEWVRNTLGREVTDADRQQQWYKDATNAAIMNTYGAAQNIFKQFKDYATRTGQNPVDAYADALAKLRSMNLTEADVLAQTGKSLRELVRGPNLSLGLFEASQLTAPGSVFDFSTLKPNLRAQTSVVPEGYYGNPAGLTPTPGDIITNQDGTRTVVPNIPGRPYGGFTGIQQLKDAYTAGGGSLGPTNLFVPKTVEDMYARYGNTGGSQQAYQYLMGKGAASIQKPATRTGELMLPYAQSVMGMPYPTARKSTQKYIFDPKTRSYILNPDYVDPLVAAEEKKKADEAAAAKAGTTTYGSGGGDSGSGAAAAAAAASGEGGGMGNSGEGGGAAGEGGWAYGGVTRRMALGGLGALAAGGQAGYNLGSYSDGGRLLRGPGDGVSDSIPATIGDKQPARLADGEFVVPARIVSELGNGSTDAGARKLYAMMDRVQRARGKTTGKGKVAKDTSADKYLPA